MHLFGLGDPVNQPDTFVNGMGILYETVKNSGCYVIGQTPTNEYRYDSTEAITEGEFVGLALDEDNESGLTDLRISKWVERIKPIFQ